VNGPRMLKAVKIGELARQAGMATSAIRFYEEAGPLPAPYRNPSGYRDYDPAVFDRLALIRAGQAIGLTLEQLKTMLGVWDDREIPCSHLSVRIDEWLGDIEGALEDLTRLRHGMMELAGEADRNEVTDCPPESVCRTLNGVR